MLLLSKVKCSYSPHLACAVCRQGIPSFPGRSHPFSTNIQVRCRNRYFWHV